MEREKEKDKEGEKEGGGGTVSFYNIALRGRDTASTHAKQLRTKSASFTIIVHFRASANLVQCGAGVQSQARRRCLGGLPARFCRTTGEGRPNPARDNSVAPLLLRICTEDYCWVALPPRSPFERRKTHPISDRSIR